MKTKKQAERTYPACFFYLTDRMWKHEEK
ncbi:hypothetical protein B14911_04214 [Bacillus sp. NRRL B-14911]|nr:hypothetical protein B14911_04214 [Bacillus sp. NRRL B-14911]